MLGDDRKSATVWEVSIKQTLGSKIKGVIEGIFVTGEGCAAMERVEEVQTIEGCGIEGDRYCKGTGFWMRYGDVCQITLIESEDLDYIENELGLSVKNGEHRRNIVTRGVRLNDLRRKRFRIGETVLEYDRPRPPCRHVQDLSEPGMTRALKGRGGICGRVVEAGRISTGDGIETD